ncbi:hopanoid-associated phosphorylase [Pseudoroseomonas wenyumeiae]|uniref:Hopanoid-associated phosphorylase n=1 Tax=Teichococcus wenyumeiae TaxID=2478470 RepID=A0A3A9JCY9_9PROT|nr:hopanoid-associated phosphorylase [Pseudoroseomonas wenyumeiae]RKK02445.1 hopanoid-associated phosphorylase [Pseudoroseomonas wenyumeiae]RMI25295.1 hopanoid-associated phosphorylase [Pseudoroseomonas wenyumeiae]
MTILAATGLHREARILAATGVQPIPGGGDAARLEAELNRLAPSARGIISIGIAGALAPGLRPGDWVVAEMVLGDEAAATDAAWAARLAAALPGARIGTMLGQDAMAAEAAAKAALHRATGALTVDMESHVAARVARRHGLPLAVARVVSDAARRTLPQAACVGMRPDGGVDLPAVLRALARAPWQLPALVRTGWEAELAFRALLRGHHLIGPGLGGPGAGDARAV